MTNEVQVSTERELARFRSALLAAPTRQGGFERLLRLVIRAWCRLFSWTLRIGSRAPLPSSGGVPGAGCVIAVAPHRAWVEPFLLVAAWPSDAARLVWLADGRTVLGSRWRRGLLPRLGVIPIAPAAGGPRAYAELVAEALAAGAALAVFPEKGPPSAVERTRTISPGFAYLAKRAGAPIVPVVVGGSHRIGRGSSFSIDLLPPIDPGPAEPDPFTPEGRRSARALTRRYEALIAELLPQRTAEADARTPSRLRWRWLGTFFH